jgi:hypothetical protein
MDVPATLEINAWDDRAARGDLGPGAVAWVAADRVLKPPTHLFPAPIDENNWRDPRVGWGLLLPEPPGVHGLSAADLATASDQPAAIQRLVRHRTVNGTPPPIFRYKPDGPLTDSTLRHAASGKPYSIDGAPYGTGPGAIPYYLLIFATPAEIPWDLQYLLNTRYCVGRLDLRSDEGLDGYVDALVSTDWQQSAADIGRTVAWAVHEADDDITALMRTAIAARVAAEYERDADLRAGAVFVDGRNTPATLARLLDELRPIQGQRRAPGLVLTTSHGLTDRTLSPAQQRASLGLLVDQRGGRLDVDEFLAQWQPDGAIWYAHACCSAGSADLSVYEGLAPPDGPVAAVLRTVTDFARTAGASVAPLPRRLLGASKPLRAFIGHVEPTFDWTLRHPESGQYLTDDIRHALYTELFSGATVGHAFRRWYLRIAPIGRLYERLRQRLSAGEPVAGDLLYYQLAQRDVMSTVIIGDPTVRLPIV